MSPAGYGHGFISYELACFFVDQERGDALAQTQSQAAAFN
jgi:hypothetical protein